MESFTETSKIDNSTSSKKELIIDPCQTYILCIYSFYSITIYINCLNNVKRFETIYCHKSPADGDKGITKLELGFFPLVKKMLTALCSLASLVASPRNLLMMVNI